MTTNTALSSAKRCDNTLSTRITLGRLDPAIERLLATLPVELPDRRTELRTWTGNLIGDVTRWSGQRRRAGLFGSEVLRRSEAAAALAKALREAGETANDL